MNTIFGVVIFYITFPLRYKMALYMLGDHLQGLSNGEMRCSELPTLCTDPTVAMCLQALSTHLPHNTAIRILPKWYLHNQISGNALLCLHFLSALATSE